MRAFASGDFSVLGGGQRGDFINQNRDGAVTPGHQTSVTGNNKTEPGDWVGDGMSRNDDFFFQLVEAEVHDVKEQLFLAIDVMIKTSLGHPERVGDVID